MTLDTIINTYASHTKNVNAQHLRDAYEFAAKAHEGQYRKSGESYIQHSLHATYTLSKLRVDEETLIACLLHDVPEDTEFTIQDVKERFGHEVAYLVNGVTKLSKVQYKDNMAEHQVESLRKMFLVMAKDLRVVLIKLADRLHNMETLSAVRPEKRLRIAKETMEIFAPLADRMGIWEIKWRLEDLCFRYIYPVQYAQLREEIQEGSEERAVFIKRVSELLKEELRTAGIVANINGRTKHLYSIYKKMQSKKKQLAEIYDLFALRIVVKDLKDCYAALGVIHDLWKPKPGRFKDYIAVPKANGYQSLHTTVFCIDGKLTEFQIRTNQMHEEAEFGVAAHWHYDSVKQHGNGKVSKAPIDQLAWVRNLMELNESMVDNKEFIERLKIDIFKDRIFVFTPLGDVKDLPAGSTCVDFAYAVHTDLGHHCVGAKVNGSIVSLETPLKTGDIIEIIINKSSTGPKRDWLKFVVTNHARNKIRGWFRSDDQPTNVQQGTRLLDMELMRLGKGHMKDLAKQRVTALLRITDYKSLDDVLAAIGDGSISISTVLHALFEPAELLAQPMSRLKSLTRRAGGKTPEKAHVLIEGQRMLTRFGKCCNPQVADNIVGFITRGSGITIHHEQCSSLKSLDKERIIHASWSTDAKTPISYSIDIVVEGDDRVGMLRDILDALSDLNVNIHKLSAQSKAGKVTGLILDEFAVEIRSIDQLDQVFRSLQQIPGVQKVYRKK